MNLNRNLAIIAVVLLIASIWTYQSSIARTDRFERGQRFLPNFFPFRNQSFNFGQPCFGLGDLALLGLLFFFQG